jgi:tetratricopeptide (TPR) repeat protein
MTESTPKYHPKIDKSIIGAIGNNNTVIQNIFPQPDRPNPHMLPDEIRDFTGRQEYIDRIKSSLDNRKIVAIDGMGGVGKSALAIQLAHRLKTRYPDAQLYVNLYGQTPELSLEPKTVLIRFLTALTGRNESQLATDLDGLVAQYRSTLAEKSALVILDNARDEAQIRDLLPSNSNCAVVVTSRSRLTGLPGTESIDLLPMEVGREGELGESELLFQAMLQNGKRVTAELETAREIVMLCGRLPIAIRIAAATLDRQIWARKSLRVYAQELAAESTRLSKLENENVELALPGQGSVRASFNLSYRGLTEAEQQLFRWAGGLPGVDFGVAVLAAAIDRDASEIEIGLGRLLEAQVLELRGEDRFGWHDLMRLFAKEQLTELERETVLDRGLTWYCRWARFWNNGLNPVRCWQLAQELAAESEDNAEAWVEASPMMALAWFTAEQANWVGIVNYLTQIPRPDDAVALACNLAIFFSRCSRWGDWVTTHEIVKKCAHQAGNLAGEALILNNLGLVYNKQGKWAEEIACYKQSIAIKRQMGDLQGEAQTFANLGNVYHNQGKWEEAIACCEQSLEISCQLDDRHGGVSSLMGLGNVYSKQGKWADAISCYKQSLEIFHQFGDRHGMGSSLMGLGNVYGQQSNWKQAIACHEKSLEILHQLGDRHSEALAIVNLGNVYNTLDKWEEAISCYEKVLEIFRQLDDLHSAGFSLANLGQIYKRRNQIEQARSLWREALTYLHPSSPEFQAVQQWLTILI